MISTHILDTTLGQPAKNVTVKLYTEDDQLLAEAQTNQDGRISDFFLSNMVAGTYRLEFLVAPYFKHLGLPNFFPKVVIYFQLNDVTAHFHIPLLISPFTYSTYRGS